MLGQALAYAPNVSAAVISASRIMQILKRKPTIADSEKVVLSYAKVSFGYFIVFVEHFQFLLSNLQANGEISFKDVNFCYPARKNVQVLKDLNMHIEAGKTIALVGASGSGK